MPQVTIQFPNGATKELPAGVTGAQIAESISPRLAKEAIAVKVNGVVRDLLLTGRSINATKALAVGLVSQLAAEGEALRLARSTAAQVRKFDRATSAAAKRFIKPVPHEELRREIEIFCELFTRPAVMEGLRKFVESTDALPYLP